MAMAKGLYYLFFFHFVKKNFKQLWIEGDIVYIWIWEPILEIDSHLKFRESLYSSKRLKSWFCYYWKVLFLFI